MRQHFAAIALVPLLLSACSAFTPPIEKPVIEDRVGDKLGTLATTAERRTVLVDLSNGHYCAEASPDAIQAIGSAITASARYAAAAARDKENDKEGKTDKGAPAGVNPATGRSIEAEFARTLATSISAVGPRTQGVLLFRDASFVMCQERVKGGFQGDTFLEQFKNLLQKSYDLIKEEIPHMEKRTAALATATAPQPPAAAASAPQ